MEEFNIKIGNYNYKTTVADVNGDFKRISESYNLHCLFALRDLIDQKIEEMTKPKICYIKNIKNL